MSLPNVAGMNRTAHAPTLVYAVGAMLILFVLYHATIGHKR